MNKLLTLAQTAEALQTSRQTVMRMVSEGALPAIVLRSGRRKKVIRIDEADLERWVIGLKRQNMASQRTPRAGEEVFKTA